MMLPAGFLAAIDGIPVVLEGESLVRRSRDNFWYSPVLRRQFADVVADAIVLPRSEEDVIAVARACFRFVVPITPRGGGTANYGQCMPIRGGIVLDLSSLERMLWVRRGAFRVQAGIRMGALEALLAPSGQELRMHPSTRDTATLGGFIAGGSGGVGSITWGMLRESGNILGARIVTLEAEPRALELRGSEIARVAHAYGTTGIITELEMPTAPAFDWVDGVVVFDDFLTAVRFGQAFAEQPAIIKKLCGVMAPSIAQAYLKPIREFVPEACSCAIVMVAEASWEPFERLAAEFGGRVTYRRSAAEVSAGGLVPAFFLCWNHTTMWALRADPRLTYLQSSFPAGKGLALVEQLAQHFGDEVRLHLEFMRTGPGFSFAGIQLVRFTTEARLEEIMAFHESVGVRQFNPHAYTIEEGGMKQVDEVQLQYKRLVDPKGLLNPGKMLAWSDPDWAAKSRGSD